MVVLTAGVGSYATLSAALNHLATFSITSTHRIFADASQKALIGDEHHATATTRAILDVVASVRHPGPLPM